MVNFVNIVRHNKIVQQPVEILSEDNNKYILKNIFQKDDLLVLDNIEATKNFFGGNSRKICCDYYIDDKGCTPDVFYNLL